MTSFQEFVKNTYNKEINDLILDKVKFYGFNDDGKFWIKLPYYEYYENIGDPYERKFSDMKKKKTMHDEFKKYLETGEFSDEDLCDDSFDGLEIEEYEYDEEKMNKFIEYTRSYYANRSMLIGDLPIDSSGIFKEILSGEKIAGISRYDYYETSNDQINLSIFKKDGMFVAHINRFCAGRGDKIFYRDRTVGYYCEETEIHISEFAQNFEEYLGKVEFFDDKKKLIETLFKKYDLGRFDYRLVILLIKSVVGENWKDYL
jgi:hypothetical protein